MAWRRLVVGLMVVLGGCAATQSARVQAPQPPRPAATAVAPTTAPVADTRSALLLSAIYQLQTASTLDAATTAYGRGIAIDPGNLALNRLYVQRAIDFESPETAYDAAQIVAWSAPTDGIARGVLAFTQARRGLMDLAAINIDIAVKSASADPFVQDTAGHLLAWFDTAVPPESIPAPTEAALRRVHLALDNEVVFGEAYQDASLYYLNEKRQNETSAENQAAGSATTPMISFNGPVGGAQVPEVQPVYYVDEVAYAEPFCFLSPGFIVVTDFFHDFRRRMHPPRHVRHHDPAFTFRDHFFGRGYRTFPATGGRGVTATAYLRERFPASFGNVVQASGFSRTVGRSAQGTYGNNGMAPTGVIPGSPGFTAFNPVGVQAGGAVNVRAAGVNPMSFGAAGVPPGFIAVPAAPPAVVPPTEAPRSTRTSSRGATVGRTSSNGR